MSHCSGWLQQQLLLFVLQVLLDSTCQYASKRLNRSLKQSVPAVMKVSRSHTSAPQDYDAVVTGKLLLLLQDLQRNQP
jgi:hypothetical protein